MFFKVRRLSTILGVFEVLLGVLEVFLGAFEEKKERAPLFERIGGLGLQLFAKSVEMPKTTEECLQKY